MTDTIRKGAVTAGLSAVQNIDRLYAAGVLMLGAFMILGVGFAHAEILHNAAHDARHAFAFPCH